MEPIKHKTIKHREHPHHARELTFSCFKHQHILDDEFKMLLSQAMDAAMCRHHWQLLGFVYMPNHVHLMVWPQEGASPISDLLFAIKRPHSFRVKQWMIEHHDQRLSSLMVRERPGKTSFRFWQEGPGYDRNLFKDDAILNSINYLHENPTRRGLVRSASEWPWSS